MADRLLADLGGTNTRVGLADASGFLPDTARSYANAGFDGLAPLLAAYLDDMKPGPIRALCAGVAGPVRSATAQLTNRDWFIDGTVLSQATGAGSVHLLNDLQAHGYGLDDLAPGTLKPLIPGAPDPKGPRLVLNLGTGCNIAVVHRLADRLFVPASESGHTTLPDWPEMRPLYDRLRADAPHLPVEAALSGPGLSNLHAALTEDHLPAADILSGAYPETITIFTRLLGAVAGNLCLSYMATGGLILTGGLARAIAPCLDSATFTAPFTARGPYMAILQAIPVSLVTDDHVGLLGCGRYLAQQM